MGLERALNSSHIAVHHSRYLESLVYDIGFVRVVVIWNAFGLKILDFARVCIARVLRGGGGTGMLGAATTILIYVLAVDETWKDSLVALVSIKDEQVVSTTRGLGGEDCIFEIEAEFEGVWRRMFSKVSGKLGLWVGWDWNCQ